MTKRFLRNFLYPKPNTATESLKARRAGCTRRGKGREALRRPTARARPQTRNNPLASYSLCLRTIFAGARQELRIAGWPVTSFRSRTRRSQPAPNAVRRPRKEMHGGMAASWRRAVPMTWWLPLMVVVTALNVSNYKSFKNFWRVKPS